MSLTANPENGLACLNMASSRRRASKFDGPGARDKLSRTRSDVALAQDAEMVCHVTRGDVGHRADAERISARDAAPRPRRAGKIAEQRDGGRAHRLEFVDETRPRAFVRRRARHRDVLVEARQRRIEAAREPE